MLVLSTKSPTLSVDPPSPAVRPEPLQFPVWWFAPFYSGSGYGSEALSYVQSLIQTGSLREADIWLTHSGDAVSPGVVKSMEPKARELLERQEYARIRKGGVLPAHDLMRPAIAICHTFPDCWARRRRRGRGRKVWGWGSAKDEEDKGMSAPGCPCPPAGSKGIAYRVGRTMFETSSLPRHLVDHANDMDEVWVPTEFNRATFVAAGVKPSKLHVVEEGIDTTHWDPASFTPLDPISLKPDQITGNPRAGATADGDAVAAAAGSAEGRAMPQLESYGGGGSGDASGGSSGASRRMMADFEARPLIGGDSMSNVHGASNSRGALVGAAGAALPSTNKPFVFLSVFKLEARKGWDVLLDAFLDEFGPGEDVELHILTRPYPRAKSSAASVMWKWLERSKGLSRARDAGRLPRVYVHSRHVADADYPRLYLGSDAVVLPTRGEGWGRPQMEAMAMGRPLITTNWSGPTAYINDDVVYPLKIDGLSEAARDMNMTDPEAAAWNTWFDGEMWAKPSVYHLRQLMRRVVTHPAEAAAKGRAARRHLIGRFAPDVLAVRVTEEVRRIQGKLQRRARWPLGSLWGAMGGAVGPGGHLSARATGDANSAKPGGPVAGVIPTVPQRGQQQQQRRYTGPQMRAPAPAAVSAPGSEAVDSYGASRGRGGLLVDEALLASAWENGFTQARGTPDLDGSVDTTTMTLSEVMAVMTHPKPRTAMRRPAPGGQQQQQQAGESGFATRMIPGSGQQQPIDLLMMGVDGVEDEDEDDGSIVLHP